jgi:hypothetical protein
VQDSVNVLLTMIAYDELERALARWKARRSAAAPVEVAPASEVTAPVPAPERTGERTGEIDLNEVEESYDASKYDEAP